MKKIYLHGKKGKGLFTLIDDEDYDLANQYTWYVNNSGYAITKVNGDVIILHRLIMNPPENLFVDHKAVIPYDENGNRILVANTLNNTRENLRIVTPGQNNMNKQPRNNNEFTGVYHKHHGNYHRWEAYIHINGKRVGLGLFPYTDEGKLDAARAYNKKALELFGEFARLNQVDGIEYNNIQVEINNIEPRIKNQVDFSLLPKSDKYVYIPLNGKYGIDKVAIVDKEYENYLSQYNWACSSQLYAYRTDDNKKIYMHREIMFLEKINDKYIYNRQADKDSPLVIDHILHDSIRLGPYEIPSTLNNIRENLRFATSQQNSLNKRINSNNSSGFHGVYHNKIKSTNGKSYYKWTAYIYVDSKTIFLGNFEDTESGKQKAAKAYNEAVKKYYPNNEFIPLNKIDESKIIPDNPEDYALSFLCTIQIDVEDRELIDKYKWNLAEGYITSTEFADGTKIDNGTKYNCVQLGKVLLGMSSLDLNSVVFRDGDYLNYHKSNLKVVYRNTKIELIPIIDGKFDMRNVDISQYQDYLGNTLSEDDLVDGFYQSNIPNTKVVQVGNRFALVDEEDFDKVIKYQWKVSNNTILIHNVRIYGFEYGVRMSIQSIILGLPDGYKFKKLNGNTFDCRKENIKIICKKKTNK